MLIRVKKGILKTGRPKIKKAPQINVLKGTLFIIEKLKKIKTTFLGSMSEPEVRVVFMKAEEIAVCEQLIAHSNSFTLFFHLLRRQDEIVWMDMEKTWLTYFIQEQIHESFSGNLCSYL